MQKIDKIRAEAREAAENDTREALESALRDYRRSSRRGASIEIRRDDGPTPTYKIRNAYFLNAWIRA